MTAFFMGDGIGIKIQDNKALAEILKDIMERAEEDGKTRFGRDVDSSYKTITSSLRTLIKLLEETGRNQEHRKNTPQQA